MTNMMSRVMEVERVEGEWMLKVASVIAAVVIAIGIFGGIR